MKSGQVNFCPGESFLKLLTQTGEWHQNLSEKTAFQFGLCLWQARETIEAAYSTCGCTSDLYAFLQTSLVDFRFCLRTFRVLVAFAATCIQWTSHLRLDWMVTPRYFVWGTFSSTVLWIE